MSSSGSDSTCAAEEEDEGKIYQWIYEVHTDDLEETFPYSSGHSPLHPESDTERRTHEADSPNEQDMDLLEDVQEIKKIKRNEECREKKPWRKPEANISDYFNYGFNEETWSAYCKKQAKLKTFKRKRAKIMTQKEHAGYGEQVPCCSHSSSSGPSIPASRESNTGVDVRGRKAGCSSTEEGHQCLTDGSSNSQVVTEMSHKKDSTTADHLPTSVSIKSLFAFVPPPPFLFQSEHSSSPAAVLVSEHPEGFCGPSTSLYRSSSGNMANSSAVIDTTKAWECYIRQEKRDKDRNRSREHGHDKESKRCRDREKHSSSSSHNRGEEQKKRKRSREHEHKHLSGDKSRRDKSEGRQKTSQSSSSRKNDCEDRDRGRKHKGREKQKRQREQQDELC